MDDIYKNTEEYNPNKRKIYLSYLMIWLLTCLVMKNSNQKKKKKKKKKNPIVTELFIRGRKLNFMQFCFAVPKNIRLNSILLLRKFDTKESFNKWHLIIYQILTFKTL